MKISLILIAMLPLCLVSNAFARSGANCGTAKVLKSNDTCAGLKIGFYLTGCGYDPSQTVPEPEIVCAGDKATATLHMNKVAYVAKLKRERLWGENYWTVVGGVERLSHKIADQETNEAKAEIEKEPVAEVATLAKHDEAVHSEKSVSTNWNGITLNGILDLYYSYNFNRPSPVQLPPVGSPTAASLPVPNNNLRNYDLYHNQISLNLAELTVKRVGTEVSFLLDLDFGQMADVIGATFLGTSSQVIDEVTKHVGQAYISYIPKWAPELTIDVGRFGSHMGLEVVKAKDNWQYSRSLLYVYGLPVWHMGAHVGYKVIPDRFEIGSYIYNGWNAPYETNSAKTFGGQLKFTPADFSIIYNVITGPEQANNNTDMRMVHELNGTWTVTPLVSIALDLIYGKENNVTPVGATATLNTVWMAGSLAAKYQATQDISVSPRIEYYNDRDGYTLSGPAQKVKTYTLTVSARVADGLEGRIEGRKDQSTSNTRFLTKTGTSTSQTTALLALLYSF